MSNVLSFQQARINRSLKSLDQSSELMMLELEQRMAARLLRRAQHNLDYAARHPGSTVPYPEVWALTERLRLSQTR